MSHLSLPEVMAQLRLLLAEMAPGHNPKRLTVEMDNGEKVKLPFGLTAAAPGVRVLWEAWENGTPDVGQDAILEAAGSDGARLRDLFKNHPGWGTLIVATGAANARTYRLNEP